MTASLKSKQNFYSEPCKRELQFSNSGQFLNDQLFIYPVKQQNFWNFADSAIVEKYFLVFFLRNFVFLKKNCLSIASPENMPFYDFKGKRQILINKYLEEQCQLNKICKTSNWWLWKLTLAMDKKQKRQRYS